MNPTRFARRLPLALGLLALGACSDAVAPAAPAPPAAAPHGLAELTCTANRAARTVTCGTPSTGASANVILGNQGQYVRLASSNVAVVADTFAFDATVQNLIAQPLGTTDWNTLAPHAAGIRVFFASGPTAPAGLVTVANADGLGTFTAAGQPYFQYDEVLPQNAVSAAKRWKLQLGPGVTSFTFRVYVSAALPFEGGYVDGLPPRLVLDPGETATVSPVVRSFVGAALSGQTVGYAFDVSGVASADGSGNVTAGDSMGVAMMSVSSGLRPSRAAVKVNVCPSMEVEDGAAVPGSIVPADCWAPFRNGPGPATDFYGDIYRLPLEAGQSVTIILDTGHSMDSWLTLAGPDGGVAAENDDANPADALDGSRIDFTAPAAGMYVIEASTSSAGATGNYTLGVTIH
ncbi:MAG TPA: PPC domain-containing protein [Longimicrobiaceae bacterium]|jgi:hypothetical protein|nr:PPC domain-containing protein [Longimicrobiaceae bacterium]